MFLGDPPEYPTIQPAMAWNVPAQTLDVPAAVYGVLTVLPPPGTHWPDVEKAKFMAALGAVLDVVYPEHSSAGAESK